MPQPSPPYHQPSRMLGLCSHENAQVQADRLLHALHTRRAYHQELACAEPQCHLPVSDLAAARRRWLDQ